MARIIEIQTRRPVTKVGSRVPRLGRQDGDTGAELFARASMRPGPGRSRVRSRPTRSSRMAKP